jgi:hypothetical protein
VEPVGADDEVVALRRPVTELDVDAVVVLAQTGDLGAHADGGARGGGALEQDPGELGARHAHRGGQVRTAGAGIRHLDEERPVRVGCAQAEGGEAVAVLLHLVPDAEVAQDPQGVALQRDPGPGRGDLRLDVDEVDVDALVGQEGGGRRAGHTGTDDEDALDGGHGELLGC